MAHRNVIESSKNVKIWGREYKTLKGSSVDGDRIDFKEADTGSLVRIAEATELLAIGHRALLDRAEKAEKEVERLQNSLQIMATARDELRSDLERFRRAIRWALGYGNFPARKKGEGAYWWRKQLRRKAGM